ncbi:MAG: thiolase domain-containing protein [Candidatus Hodarchaeales archaeon]|jgi:acetyl-CoA C-acetyltransferase
MRVGVIGVGHSKFGKRAEATIRDLSHEAVKPAFEEAGLTPKDVDAIVFSLAGDQFNGQGSPAALVSDYVGTTDAAPIRVESACASGSAALKTATAFIESGLHDKVLVVATESMSHVSTPEATELMSRAGDMMWEYPFGISFPAYYAIYASRRMAEGLTRAQLSAIPVKSHEYGVSNSNAHLQKTVSLEEAMKSIVIAHPLNLYDCCPISDGSAAAILASEKAAKELTDTPVWITGVGTSGDTMQVADRPNLTNLSGAKRAGEIAYKMAGIEPKDVSFAEVHDCFSIAELMSYEDLGFCPKGEGGKFAEDGQMYIGGSTPVNIDGGLKSKGHPIGATGVSQCYEITRQLRGEVTGKRAVEGAETALQHNVGMHGTFVNVLIYQR